MVKKIGFSWDLAWRVMKSERRKIKWTRKVNGTLTIDKQKKNKYSFCTKLQIWFCQLNPISHYVKFKRPPRRDAARNVTNKNNWTRYFFKIFIRLVKNDCLPLNPTVTVSCSGRAVIFNTTFSPCILNALLTNTPSNWIERCGLVRGNKRPSKRCDSGTRIKPSWKNHFYIFLQFFRQTRMEKWKIVNVATIHTSKYTRIIGIWNLTRQKRTSND